MKVPQEELANINEIFETAGERKNYYETGVHTYSSS